MFLKDDLTVIVLNNIVAVQSVAVPVEVVGAFGTRVALHVQDRLADLLGLEALGVVDGERQHMNRVVGPCSEEVGRRSVGSLVFDGELLRGGARVPIEVDDGIGSRASAGMVYLPLR